MTPFSKKLPRLSGCAESAVIFIKASQLRKNAPTVITRRPIFKSSAKIISCHIHAGYI